MDTSDSECFESADESFHSGDETVISNPMKNLCEQDVSKNKTKKLPKETQDNKCSEPETKSSSVTKDSEEKEVCLIANKLDSLKTSDTKKENVNQSENVVSSCEITSSSLQSRSKDNKQQKIEAVEKNCEKIEKKVDNISRSSKSETEQKSVESISKPNKIAEVKDEENLWENDGDWGDDEYEVETVSKQKEPSKWKAWLDEEEIDFNEVEQKSLCSRYIPNEDRWEVDAWEPVDEASEKILENIGKTPPKTPENTWGGWGNWGVSSLLSTATQITSNVSKGLTNVLESGIGVPDPEELARMNKIEREKLRETVEEKEETESSTNTSLSFGLGNLVSGVTQITKIVESTGNKVITSGLDTLETIGKKTMEVLQEGDPGLKKKRAFLKIDQEKPVLSQLLREAKEKAEQENKVLQQKHLVKKPNYESIFDDYQGLVHLEALEMLSKQCDIKLQTLLETQTSNALKEMQETMEQVKELCEIPDEDEEENLDLEEIKKRLESALGEINVAVNYDKLISTWEETETWLNNLNLSVCNEGELHQQAIETLAQLTAFAVEQFHKMGELLLVKEHRSTADEADSLVQ